MNEQLIYDVIGGISLLFVVPTIVWILLSILRIKTDVAVIEKEIEIRTKESAERHKETAIKFDKLENMLGRIEMTLVDLRERFSSHNGWERNRAAQQNGKHE